MIKIKRKIEIKIEVKIKKENNNIEINDKNLEKSEEENNKNILKESIGVTAYINAIHEKIDNEKKRMLEENKINLKP